MIGCQKDIYDLFFYIAFALIDFRFNCLKLHPLPYVSRKN